MTQKFCATIMVAVLAVFTSFASEPLAVWSGDFTATTKGDLSLDANGNQVAADGSTITITQSNGVLVDGFPSGTSAFTVLVKYSNLNLTASATQSLLTAMNSENNNRIGILLRANDGRIIGLASGADWDSSNNIGSTPPESGTLALTLASGSGTYVYIQGTSGSIYGASALKYRNDNYDGVAVGGLRTATNIAAASGMVIEGIAVFNSVITQDDINAFTWPERENTELVWTNVGETFTINGASGVNVNTLTLPVPEGMYAGDKVILKSVGIVYRGTSYADEIALTIDDVDVRSELHEPAEAISNLVHKGTQGYLVRYPFDNVEVPVGTALTIKNLSINAILVQPNSYSVVSQSSFSSYSLVYEVKAEKIPEEISVYTWHNRDTSLARNKAACPYLKLRLLPNDVFKAGDVVKITSIKIAGRDSDPRINYYLKVAVGNSEILSNQRVEEPNWKINPTGSTRTADTFIFPEATPLILTVGETYDVTALNANKEVVYNPNQKVSESGGATCIQYEDYQQSDLWWNEAVSTVNNYVPIYEIVAEKYEAPFVAPDEFGSTTRVLTTIEMPLENSIPVKYQRQFLKELATRYEITAHLGGNGIYSGSRTLPAQVRYLALHSDGVLTFEVQAYDSPHTKCAIVGVYFDENGALIFKQLGSAYKNNGNTTDSMFSYADGTATRRSGFSGSDNGYLLQGVTFKRAAKLDTSVAAPEVIANSAVLHYDASDYDNFTFNEDGEVTQWNDLSANQNHATPSATSPNDVVKNGRLELVNGIPAFQMGATGSGIDLAFNTRCTALLTAFWVVDIKQSAGAFLLADGLRYPLHRGNAGQLLDSTNAHQGLRTGTVSCDGRSIADPTVVLPPDGVHVYAIRSSTGAFVADRLSQDRTCDGRNGGRAISELILFNTKLTDEEIAEVNDYLVAKWGVEAAAPKQAVSVSSPTTERYVFDNETTSVMSWQGDSETEFCSNDSEEDPVVTVAANSTLEIGGQDYSGWLGSITDTCWFKIDGTLVFLEGSGSRFWRDHLLLGDGAVVKIDHGGRNLLLYGGVGAEDNAQIMLPRGAASIVVGEAGDNAAIHLGNDNSLPYGDKGAGISVGEGATLTIEVPIKGGDPIAKWGEGTLILSGSLASFTGTITVNGGAVKVKNTASLSADKIVMEEREGYVIKAVSDSTWTTYAYVEAGESLKYGYSFNGNCDVNPKATGSLGIGDWSSDIFNNALVIGKSSGNHYGNSGFAYGDGDWTILSVVRAPGENEVIYALGGQKTTEGLIGLRNAGNNTIEAFTTNGVRVTSVTLDHNPRLGYHLYALTFNASSGELTMSVDGEEGTEPVEFTPGTGAQWQFGGIHAGQISPTHVNASSYRGALDEFRFYERALSAEELAEIAAEFALYDPAVSIEPIVINSDATLPTIPPDYAVTYRYEGEKALENVPFYSSSYDGVIELACPVNNLGVSGQITGSNAIVFNEGFSVLSAQEKLILGNNGGVTQNYTQNAGDLVFTGEGVASSQSNSILLFAHWNSDVIYNLLGGSITAVNGLSRLGWDGRANVLVGGGQDSALLKLAGLYEPGRNNPCSLSVFENGMLEITSESGITLTTQKYISLCGGTLKFDETCSMQSGTLKIEQPSIIEVAAGKTVTISSSIIDEGSIEKTGAGTLVIAGTIADTINIVLAEGSVVVPEEFEATRILPPTGVHPDDKTVVTENGVTTYTFGRPAPGAGEVYRYEGTEPLAYVPFHGVGFEGTIEVACPVMDLALNDGIPGKFKGAKNLVVFDEGFSVVNPQIRMQIGNNNGGNQHFIQKAGTIDCLLDGNGNDQNYMAILFGHWPSENSYTLQGGALIATNGVSALGWDGTIALTVGGGDKDALLKLYGVRGDAKNNNAILTLLQNGTLEITSDYGISLNDAKTIALNGGTLKFDESCEVSRGTITFGEENSSIIEVAEGKIVVISSAITGTGHVVKTGLGTLEIAEGKPEIEIEGGRVVYRNAPLATITESTAVSSLELASDASGVITIQGAESEDAAYTVTFDEEISENVTFTVTGYATIAAAEGIRIANDLTIKTDATLNIEGVVELNETMSLIQEQGSTLVIRPEARLVVTRDNQIANIGIKRVYGTLDLNGHLLKLNNDPSYTVLYLYAGSIIEHGEFFLDGGFSHTINLSDSDSEDKLVHVNAAFRTSRFGQGFTFKFNADEGVGIVFNGGILNQGDLEFTGSAIFTQPTANLQNVLKGTGSIIVDAGEGDELVFNAVNTFTGGLIVKSGTAKTKNANGYGPNNYNSWATPEALGQIEVKARATLDLANTINTCYAITTAGTITNSGDDIGTTLRQTVKIALSGDATVSGNTFGLLAPYHNATTLDLGEHTLTVAMNEGKQFLLGNATVSGSGVIKLKSGSLWINQDKSLNGTIKLDLSGFPKVGGTVATGTAEQLAQIVLAEGQIGWSLVAEGTTLKAVYSNPIVKIGETAYDTLEAALAHLTDGAVVTILKPEEVSVQDFTDRAVTLTENEDGTYTATLDKTDAIALRFSEIMPKPSDKPYEITTQAGYDKNGLESGWVELENTIDKWVDLKDYKFCRANRGKVYTHADYGNFPSVMIPPHGRFTFYTSERYSNSASKADSAFEHGTFDGKPVYYPEYDMLIWGDKVNPKKFPYVTLVYKPEGATKDTILETVIIPSDTPEGYSIIVGEKDETSYTKRWLCSTPTCNTANTDTSKLTAIGPNVGPRYGVKHSVSTFTATPPAKSGENYPISLNVNPVYGGTEKDAISKVVLVYRTKLGKGVEDRVEMTKSGTDAGGDVWTAAIPSSSIPSEPGQLIQWKTEITDAAGNEWTSPSFMNKDDGYEWFGTITEPDDLNSATLPTWHMFADELSLKWMDTDADAQSKTEIPNQARVAIYDASTSNYYDYVRIDLRGNTSSHFNKKSHGLRFSKVHPLTMKDAVQGGEVKEIRKSSLIGEPADPSFMRQMVAFWLWDKMGNKVPFDFPVRCNLNGEFYQLGFHSERFTDELIEDVYGLDKYGYGYKNVGTLASNSGTAAGGIEKKTPDDGNESDISVLQNELRKPMKELGADSINEDNAGLTKFVVEKFDLPAWLNYLASARITQEMDDVWANISIYKDDAQMLEGTRGTGMWMPLGYDFNVSFGQYYHDGVVDFRSDYKLMSNQDWFKSHPFYGGMKVRCHGGSFTAGTVNSGNRAMEAVWQSSKFRRLYLRRLRTLMDQELKAPGTPETEVPFMVKMRELAELMYDDSELDHQKNARGENGWDSSFNAIDSWGQANWPKDIKAGVDDIWNNYVVPRRQHLYVTHAAEGHTAEEIGYDAQLCAGIPSAQSPIESLKDKISAEYGSMDGVGIVVIFNANNETIDMSGWTLGGPVQMTLPPGTVIDSMIDNKPGYVYIVTDRRKALELNPNVTDEVIIGNGVAGKDDAAITLVAADGTEVISAPTDQQLYVRLWGFTGAPKLADEDWGEAIVLTNLNQSAAIDLGGMDINFCGSDKTDDKSKCHFVLVDGTMIPAGGFLRIKKTDTTLFTVANAWDKIANHGQRITIKDKNGALVQHWELVDQDALGVYLTGLGLKYNYDTSAWVTIDEQLSPGWEDLTPPPPPPVDPEDPTEETYPEDATILTGMVEEMAELSGNVVLSNAMLASGMTLTGDTTIYLARGTTNGVPSIVSAGAITIEGSGELDVYNIDGAEKSAAITFTTAGKGYVQNGGTVMMTLYSTNQVYGIYAKDLKNVTAKFNGGVFNVYINGGDGSAAIKMNKGSNDVTLNGTEINITLGGTAPRFANVGGHIEFTESCGKVNVSTIAGEGANARVFKTEKKVKLNGGVIVGDASGEGAEMFSAGNEINMTGGVINVTAADDCFSAATNIVISAGIIHAVSTAGDALDSNGSMSITGGHVFAFTKSSEHEALDVTPGDVDDGLAHTLTIGNGAVVLAVGGKQVGEIAGDAAILKVDEETEETDQKYVSFDVITTDLVADTVTTRTYAVNWTGKHVGGIGDGSKFAVMIAAEELGETYKKGKNPDKNLTNGYAYLMPDYDKILVKATMEELPGGLIKDGNNWTLDTTKETYVISRDENYADWQELARSRADINVTLKSRSENSATIAFSNASGAQGARYVIESGAHTLEWEGNNAQNSFIGTSLACTDDNPTILVKGGATLNFKAKDVTGWNRDVKDVYNNIFRVNDGGRVNLLTYNDHTFYFQGRWYLDPGAVVEALDFSEGKVCLNGGIYPGYPQIYIPAPCGTNTVATYISNAGFNLAKDSTIGYAVEVAAGATLSMQGAITTANTDAQFAKYGMGALELTGTIAEGVKFVLYDGTIKTKNKVNIRLAGDVEGEIASTDEDGWIVYSVYVEPAMPEFNPETDILATNAVLRFSEIMPKPSDKPNSITSEAGYDKNGLESGWVELENTSETEWADLADYKFIRVNRSKANEKGDYGSFPSVKIPPKYKYVFYTSERYSNSASPADSAFEHGTFDGKPKYFEEYNMMIWGDKINPKKFPFVRLYYAPGGEETSIIDTVVIPSDIPEGNSIVVTPVMEGEATIRYMTSAPTKGKDNGSTDELIPLGPNAGPLYEISGGKKHNSASEFARVSAPAKAGEDYVVTFSMNPTMSPTEAAKFRAEDTISNIVMIVRKDLDNSTITNIVVDLTTKTTDSKDWGDTYTATIPKEYFPEEGHLIQWKFLAMDAACNIWMTPSFHNPDDGYEWYGTIVESDALTSKTLPTWHMFADAASIAQMDKDTDDQNLNVVPHNARVAIYDSSTSNYYDYVRIDLRGNTSAHFSKKSHGLRFAKAHPLTMWDAVAGETRKEIRKSSLIGEPADPSRMRQMMSFWLWNKMGNKVPFDFPVRCNLNGEFYQLGFHSERFTDELIEDVYGLDKYGYGYKNVGSLASNSGTSAGGIEKKTPDDGNESDLSMLESSLRKPMKDAGVETGSVNNEALTRLVVEKFDLPAWLNYQASARITQEMDDVWANISAYYDFAEMKEGARGTGTWMPLGYDFNLSLGQWYWNDIRGDRSGLMATEDWFKSHPLYGGKQIRANYGAMNWNRGIESVLQNEKFRRLYLRRLRTLMDQELKAPGTSREDVPLMAKMAEVADLMRADAALDCEKYPWDSTISNIDVWGKDKFPATMDLGIDEIWTDYIQPRQTHLYVTHSITNTEKEVGYGMDYNAGIPEAQSAIESLKDKIYAEYGGRDGVGIVAIVNANNETIDMSGWTLGGPVQMTLPPGTVIDSMIDNKPGYVYIVTDRRKALELNPNVTDEVIIGNGVAGKDDAAITLVAADGTEVISAPTDQSLYVRLWGFTGAPKLADEDWGEAIVLTNLNQTAAIDLGGMDINFCASDKADDKSKCHFVLVDGTMIPAGGFIRIKKTDTTLFTVANAWDKIANHGQRITIKDKNGALVQHWELVDQDALGVYLTGLGLKYNYETSAWETIDEQLSPGWEDMTPPPVDPVDPVDPSEETYPEDATEYTGEYAEAVEIAGGNVLFNGATFNAGVTIAADTTIYLARGTTNGVPSIVSAGAITIEGSGELDVNNIDGAEKSAAITFTTAGKGYVQNGGMVLMNLISTNQVYGIYAKDLKNVTAKFNGGVFNTTIQGGDGSAAIKMNKGSNDVTLNGTEINITLGGTAPRFANVGGHIEFTESCGKVNVSTIEGEGANARVFKTEKKVKLNGGVIVGEASGEGAEMFSADNEINMTGGVINVTAADDCFSAATNIVVSAGVIHAVSTAGDALDSNGSMSITGGHVFAFTKSSEHEALDVTPGIDDTMDGVAHTLTIDAGATVVAVSGKTPEVEPTGTATFFKKSFESTSNKFVGFKTVEKTETLVITKSYSVSWEGKITASPTILIAGSGLIDAEADITNPGKDNPDYVALNENIAKITVKTDERMNIKPSGVTTWEDIEVTEETQMDELVTEEQAAILVALRVKPTTVATWAKLYQASKKPGVAINLEAFALDCAPTEEAIEEAKKNFKVTISFDENGNIVIKNAEGVKVNIEPEIKGSRDLKNWHDKTDDDLFFKAVIEFSKQSVTA